MTGRFLTTGEENDIVTEESVVAEVRAADRGETVCFSLMLWKGDWGARLCSAGKDDCDGRDATACSAEKVGVSLTVCSAGKDDWRRRLH